MSDPELTQAPATRAELISLGLDELSTLEEIRLAREARAKTYSSVEQAIRSEQRRTDERREERKRTGETVDQQNKRRRAQILTLRAQGMTFAVIGKTLGISTSRAAQVAESEKRRERRRKQNRPEGIES
jgi:DNA-binding NarL/FixJ family response regulator